MQLNTGVHKKRVGLLNLATHANCLHHPPLQQIMAIDFLILTLLLFSFVINLLALGAFWVTPGLRTTANRFTINLLVINLIGCLILAPTLFLSQATHRVANEDATANASTVSLAATTSDDRIEILAKPGNRQMTIKHNGKLVEQEGVIVRRNLTSVQDARTIETIYKCNSTYCQELTIDEGTDTIVITEIEEANHHAEAANAAPLDVVAALLPRPHIRCWSIDMAAALGALGVLLVVGDTWCAVTDPLRYHTRISSLKTWIFIALTWVVGLMFGALSAFREIDFTTKTVLHEQQGFAELSLSSANSIFAISFACVYFVIIILLPFGFVCGMYWRIFSEARENGLRMRQNGSSPLLQSALNLTHHQQSSSLQYANMCAHRNSVSSASSNGGGSASERGGLQMQIDQRKSSPVCGRRDSAAKVLLPTISDDGLSDEAAQLESGDYNTESFVPLTEQPNYADRNQNILLTLQTASGEIKRNYSARQLPLLGTSSQDLLETNRLQGVRQVHSSPNLHKYTQEPLESSCSPHLLGHTQLHPHHAATTNTTGIRQQHFVPQNAHNRQHSHVLQIPCLPHSSPKALSYMSTLRHRLSNASSLFKYREESRTVRISILVIIMFLVSYLPYGFLVLLQSRLPSANFEHSTQLAIFMLLLGNLTSPFIFAYRNKRVRRGVKRLFGLEASTRERSLQRQSSSSGRGSGFLNRHCTGTRNGANIRRNISKVSTYSLNSCKFLTPQNSLSSAVVPPAAAAVNRHSSPARIHGLRPNSSCSTIINFGAPPAKEQALGTLQQQQETTTVEATQRTATKSCDTPTPLRATYILNMNGNSPNGTARITEALPAANGKFVPKRSLFKIFFQSSKNLGCAAAQSCAQGKDGEVEPADV